MEIIIIFKKIENQGFFISCINPINKKMKFKIIIIHNNYRIKIVNNNHQ